jgi:thiamine biosynthesis protein ThiS
VLSHNVEKQVVTVQINGELREVPEGLTLAALIEWLKLPRDRVAVERNLEIVPRARWNVTPIQAGDQLEVVHLVGGGMQGQVRQPTDACPQALGTHEGCPYKSL